MSEHSPKALKAEGIVEELGRSIAVGSVRTGERLTLSDISARFGVSRTVAREAMRALEQLGMVESSPRLGLTVLPLGKWHVFDRSVIAWRLEGEKSRQAQLDSLNELRVAIEPLAARHCARRASDSERADIVALAERLCYLEANPSPKVGEELMVDLQFHARILEASGNEMFAAMAPSLIAMFKGKSVYGSVKRDPVAGTAELHLDLARAIAAGDAATAEKLSRHILDMAGQHEH